MELPKGDGGRKGETEREREGERGRTRDRVRGRNSKGECWEMGERAPR